MILGILGAFCVRGKGGLFAEWGWVPKGKNNLEHGLGAFIMALGINFELNILKVPWCL